MPTGDVVAHIVEGRTHRVSVVSGHSPQWTTSLLARVLAQALPGKKPPATLGCLPSLDHVLTATCLLPQPLSPQPSCLLPQVHMDAEGNPTKQPGKVASAFILKHCPVEVRQAGCEELVVPRALLCAAGQQAPAG